MAKLNLFIITALGILFTIAESMRFDLNSGNTKCIGEDIKSNSMTVGKYNVVLPNEADAIPDSHKLTVKVNPNFILSFNSKFHHVILSGFVCFFFFFGLMEKMLHVEEEV